MPDPAALVNELIARIPEDGRRITNEEIRAALEREAGEPIGEEALKELKSQVVAMGFAERVKGPGGGLKAPGVAAPPPGGRGCHWRPFPARRQSLRRPRS